MKKLKTLSVSNLVFRTPTFSVVLLGFFLSYLIYFAYPTFMSSEAMQIPEYVPAMDLVGADFKEMLQLSKSRVLDGKSVSCLYPPAANLLFAPFTIVRRSIAYKILVLLDIFLYVLITLILPFKMNKNRQSQLIILIVFITGLFSYGFQFELERGQWNLISISLCIVAIWLFHYRHNLRPLSYVLFSIAVQIKVFPMIFLIMFIENWRDWKNNIIRLTALVAFNIAALFIMGSDVFMEFTKTLQKGANNPDAWAGNHSIYSFVGLMSVEVKNLGWQWTDEITRLIRMILLAVTLFCIFLIMVRAYKYDQRGIQKPLLLACAIGASLIPSISHDYKLSILTAPIAFYIADMPSLSKISLYPSKRIAYFVSILVLSTAYSSTLYSYVNKPKSYFLQNNFPALFVILVSTVFLTFLFTPKTHKTAYEFKLPTP